MSSHPTPPGHIEFELTDFGDARRVLDQLPDGLVAARQAAPDYWTARRRAPAPTDRALSGDTLDWIIGLPSAVRPVQLCERFPRVANAVAQGWPSLEHCENQFTDLLTDRRGQRRGFPFEVLFELERLGKYRTTVA